jgi:hypothetical protein
MTLETEKSDFLKNRISSIITVTYKQKPLWIFHKNRTAH